MNEKSSKIPVAILGATGMVGQKFVELLIDHPFFEIVSLAASERSVGKTYLEAAAWKMPSPLPCAIANKKIVSCTPNQSDFPCKIVFSSLDSSVAGQIEEAFALAGYIVISNSRNHRMNPFVPLLVPEINFDHLNSINSQPYFGGAIITNPNCSVVGLAIALKPLVDQWGVDQAHVVTMQAVSGAGYPGVSSFDIIDNVIPFISGEEEKIETEPLKILGSYTNNTFHPYPMKISAQCNRVAVMDGHLASVSVKLKNPAKAEEIIDAWTSFQSEPQRFNLPLAPIQPIHYLPDEKHPQPKLHRNLDKQMAVSIGQLRPCPLLDWKFTLLSHNTIRGAAGCAILNAELLVIRSQRDSVPLDSLQKGQAPFESHILMHT